MTNTFELDYLLDLVRDALKKNNAATAQTQQQPATDTKTQQPAVSTQEKPINLGPTDAEPGKVPTKTKTGPKNKPVATTPVSDIEDEEPVKV